MRRAKRKGATALGFAEPQDAAANVVHRGEYHTRAPESTANLTYQIGALLWYFELLATRQQRKAGYKLLRVLLDLRYGEGRV